MFARKAVREYSFLSKDVQPPFSLNTTDVCFRGNKIGSVSSAEKLSNKKGSLYTAIFTSPVEIKNNHIYYNNVQFAEIVREKELVDDFEKNTAFFFDPKKSEKKNRAQVWSSPVIEKQEDSSSSTQPLLDRINKKIKDWDYDELFDLYDKICNMK